MITASFAAENGRLIGFCIKGHSGYAESGSDIVCAAVSAMAFLTVNTLTDKFGLKAESSVNGHDAELNFKISSPCESSDALLAGFLHEMQVLSEDFAEYVRVEIV